MVIKSTLIKVLIIALIAGLVLYFTQEKHTPNVKVRPDISSTPTPTTPIVFKEGWTKENEQSILDSCPLKTFNPSLCKCALKKAEEKYTFKEAQVLYDKYQNTGEIDPKIRELASSCI